MGTRRHILSRPSLWITLSLALFALSSRGCVITSELQSDCDFGDGLCVGGVAHKCDSGAIGPGSKARHWVRTRCGSESLCKIDNEGGFCTLTEEPDARCKPFGDDFPNKGHFCEQSSRTLCRSGYPVEEWACESCGDDGSCLDPFVKGCSMGSCEEGLVCGDGPSSYSRVCQPPCDCPAGEECRSCDHLGRAATFAWVCVDKACRQKEY